MSLESKTFVLSFMAVIWKQITNTVLIYCKHNKIRSDHTSIVRVMKYEIYSKTGIYENVKPYFVKALTDGFLMPCFYRSNTYATESVKLFESAYKIVKSNNQAKEIKFLKDHSANISGSKIENGKMENGKCVCNLCELIESWDINIDLLFIENDDMYRNRMMKTLLSAINIQI